MNGGLVTKSCPTLAVWTVAHQAPLSLGFPRQEYWSGLPFPSPVDLPNPGIKPWSPALQADSLSTEPPGNPLWIWWVIVRVPLALKYQHYFMCHLSDSTSGLLVMNRNISFYLYFLKVMKNKECIFRRKSLFIVHSLWILDKD